MNKSNLYKTFEDKQIEKNIGWINLYVVAVLLGVITVILFVNY